MTAFDGLSADGVVSTIAPTNQGQAVRTTEKSRCKGKKKNKKNANRQRCKYDENRNTAPNVDNKKEIWSASEVQNDNSFIASDGSQSKPNTEQGSTSNGTPSKSKEISSVDKRYKENQYHASRNGRTKGYAKPAPNHKHSIIDPRFEKGGENELSPEERLGAEVMNETLKKAIGDDSVLIDGEVGQRVLDDANKRGKVRD